ncbi:MULTISPECIES: ATP-dependent DNA ligase [Subtercola]|uniref:ATP-dependent DNA ligase n=1 Tax=Subtercola vilae TaxID=2056433 RepID=A0A4T2BZN4_9MICO|nr:MULTISPECIES: ATP-dependent DNA ligase [Subtercola]MEA9985708.1 ATP-dependent DNA ligase [Subtercola sp. RTI3]TIH37117.1 ATP-dependent DNA ligase [Subtercola vilae]
MGMLTYGSPGTDLHFDDRLLAHLQAVITAKLRRDEKFGFTCSAGDGGGYVSVWVHPAIPLVFRFDGAERPTLNRAWIEALMQSANSGGGLSAVAEPA